MAHNEQRDFCSRMRNIFPEYFTNKKVLDIGSLDINGNNRFLFTDCDYIGLDVGEGNNVDVVSVGHLYDGPDEYFDTIISTEVFEHDMFYEKTIKNIIRMLKPGGAFIFTCASEGRPEHGTRRCGEHCAPLLIQISEDWADYYKNLNEDAIKKIDGFTNIFPDGIFEYNDKCEIPGDLYFFGIKGGIKNARKYQLSSKPSIINSEDYQDDIFVVGCWPDTEEKENDLIQTIQKLKEFNGIPIMLASHYPIKPEIQKLVDFYFFDKDNPLLLQNEFDSYDVSSGLWIDNYDYHFISKNKFHHDYAIWVLMQKVFKFCDTLGKKQIHYLEYDNLIDTFQYRQSFLENSKNYDAVIYEYVENSSSNHNHTEYIATYIFSIKTDVAIKTISGINSKFEYFNNRRGGFQLERLFLSELKKHTNSLYVSPYIANNNELNTQAVWNRDGVMRDDAAFQIYLGVDKFDDLYICLISGFFDYKPLEDYLIEYRYGDKKEFVKLSPNEYKFIDIGKYRKGKTVYVNYNGIEVFKEFLEMDVNGFRNLNEITIKNEKILNDKSNMETQNKNEIQCNFIDGARVDIIGNTQENYSIDFIDSNTNTSLYQSVISNNNWAKSTIQYFVDWLVKAKGNGNYTKEFKFELKNTRVLISFESFSLGDTIAWFPYVDEFSKKHNCSVIVSTPHKDLFESEYPNIEIVSPGSVVHNISAHYRLGLFIENGEFNFTKHPNKPNEIPLQKVASDILGLEYKEIKPRIKKVTSFKSDKPYICLGIHSTAQAKYWNNPTGWQELVDYVKSNGYDVYVLSREEDGYMGNKFPDGVIHIQNKTLEEIAEYLVGSEGFVGVSSGLSWYSWALNVPTILISGFTDEDLEMKTDVVRIINKDVCNGCWAKHMFDKGDWNWCPEHNGTERHFECSKTITFEMVKPHLEKFF
jgi:autotransporter strand-loop-strand O-heptosyltransferase